MEERIRAVHQRTYEAIFSRPLPAELEWSDVRSLLVALATLVAQANGSQRFQRRGRTFLYRPEIHHGRATGEHITQLQRFLEGATTQFAAAAADGAHLVVMLDAREGRIYRLLPREGEPETIEPYDPRGAGRALYYLQDTAGAQPAPGRESFHEAIARAMRGAARILVAGRGKSAAEPVQSLLKYLHKHETAGASRLGGPLTLPDRATPQDCLVKIKALHIQTLKAEPAEPYAAA